MKINFPSASVVVSAIALVGLAGTVSAQDALGSGNALDRNLGVGSGGVNTRIAPEDFRARNLIVTGNVAGGRGFRGSVGYRAESDFRGNLGSNDLYTFRAQSQYSDPELFRLGSTTYEQLRFGQDMGMIEFSRSGSGATGASVLMPDAQPPSFAEITAARTRVDRANLLRGSAAVFEREAEPLMVGQSFDEKGDPLYFNASTVRGLTLESGGDPLRAYGLSSYDIARARQDLELMAEQGITPDAGATDEAAREAGAPEPSTARVGQSFETRFAGALAADTAVTTETESSRVQPGGDDYAKILQRIAERYAGNPNVDVRIDPKLIEQLDKDYRGLRQQLGGETLLDGRPENFGIRQTDRTGRTVLPEVEPETEPQMPEAPDQPTREGVKPGEEPKPGAEPVRPGLETARPDFGVILRHGERVERLSGAQQDRFNELLASAEQNLRDGDYLSAEQRFERALRFTPGQPLALAGLGHAQLGAGLYLSASLTLRNLLSAHPEMIDVEYSPRVLPQRERLDKAIADLRGRLEMPTDQAAHGFLLAYLGHQVGDRDMIKGGLDAMAADEPDDPLLPLLRAVWLEGAAAPAALPPGK